MEAEVLVAGVTVGSKGVTIVTGIVSTEKITIQSDTTHNLHKGERPAAYRMMRERLTQWFAGSNIELVVFKGSAAGQRAATKALLESAELRGVCISADVTPVFHPVGTRVRQ